MTLMTFERLKKSVKEARIRADDSVWTLRKEKTKNRAVANGQELKVGEDVTTQLATLQANYISLQEILKELAAELKIDLIHLYTHLLLQKHLIVGQSNLVWLKPDAAGYPVWSNQLLEKLLVYFIHKTAETKEKKDFRENSIAKLIGEVNQRWQLWVGSPLHQYQPRDFLSHYPQVVEYELELTPSGTENGGYFGQGDSLFISVYPKGLVVSYTENGIVHASKKVEELSREAIAKAIDELLTELIKGGKLIGN